MSTPSVLSSLPYHHLIQEHALVLSEKEALLAPFYLASPYQ